MLSNKTENGGQAQSCLKLSGLMITYIKILSALVDYKIKLTDFSHEII